VGGCGASAWRGKRKKKKRGLDRPASNTNVLLFFFITLKPRVE